MRISERDLILPALSIISDEPGISTSALISELKEMLKPTGEDAEILRGRSDTKFSQIVRNLVSHETLVKLGYATYIKGKSRRSGGKFHITETGLSYLDENFEIVDNLIEHGFPYKNVLETMRKIQEAKSSGKKIDIVDENLVIYEGRRRKKTSIAYERSDAVRKAAIEYYRREDGHIICTVCNFDFFKTYGQRGKDYIEIHHETPLSETEGGERKEFLGEAIQNVKPVCSNCHKMIHRKRNDTFSVEMMKRIIKSSRL
ncbi:MAG: hypothetical protein HN392_01275 [Anaerolineae bacterium]|jgi:5-methylcytosine-specific restriction endonuclease McrA|nr:hypothetical protein [Anaerolineae bacterium]